VDEWTLEAVEPVDGRPFPLVDKATGVHQDVAPVGKHFAFMFNLDLPLTNVCMPGSSGNFVVQFYVF